MPLSSRDDEDLVARVLAGDRDCFEPLMRRYNQRMFRAASSPFQVGDTVTLSDLRFEVTRVTEDGRPAEVVVRFDKALDDPSLLWVRWDKHEYVPFEPPPVGASTVLPRVDPFSIMFEAPESSL